MSSIRCEAKIFDEFVECDLIFVRCPRSKVEGSRYCFLHKTCTHSPVEVEKKGEKKIVCSICGVEISSHLLRGRRKK